MDNSELKIKIEGVDNKTLKCIGKLFALYIDDDNNALYFKGCKELNYIFRKACGMTGDMSVYELNLEDLKNISIELTSLLFSGVYLDYLIKNCDCPVGECILLYIKALYHLSLVLDYSDKIKVVLYSYINK